MQTCVPGKSRSVHDSERIYPKEGESKPTALLLQGIFFFKLLTIYTIWRSSKYNFISMRSHLAAGN